MPLKILPLKFKILSRILGELTFFGKVVLLALCAAALYAVYELTGLAHTTEGSLHHLVGRTDKGDNGTVGSLTWVYI